MPRALLRTAATAAAGMLAVAVAASAIVTTNLNRKRALRMASVISWRNPIPAKKRVAATAMLPAIATANTTRRPRGDVESLARRLISSSVFTTAAPIQSAKRLECTVQGDANGALRHQQAFRRLANGVAIQ